MSISPINFAQTTQVQLRRGTTSQIAANPPVEAEPFYDTLEQRMGVGGGSQGIIQQWKSQFLEHQVDASGSVPVNMRDKLTEIISVKDFGAVGDGVTDDTDAIQKAVDSLMFVLFPAGRYRISKIELKSDRFLLGYCSELLIGEGSNGLVIDGCENVTIYGISLSGKNSTVTNGITLLGSNSDIKIDNIHFDSISQFSIEVSGKFNRLTIRNCVVKNHGRPGVGVSIGFEIKPTQESFDLMFFGNYADVPSANGGSCAKFQNVSRAVVSNSIFIRGSGGSPSQSQALMIGASGNKCKDLNLTDITIKDDTSAYGPLYLGSGSENISIENIVNIGTSKDFFIGGCSDVAINNLNNFNVISLGTPNLSNVVISGCKIHLIDFYTDKPTNVTGLSFIGNNIENLLRIDSSGSSSSNSFSGNIVGLGDGNEHFIYSDGFSVMNNIFDVVGSASGAFSALVVNGSGHKIGYNTFNINSNRQFGIFANNFTGDVFMNSFYGFTSAYKTESGGSPTFFHNNVNGSIL